MHKDAYESVAGAIINQIDLMSESISIALQEFIHVGLAITVIIAGASVITGIISALVPCPICQN